MVVGATTWHIGSGLLAGCASETTTSDTLIVHGTASQQLRLDNARAVAIGTDGRTFWAYLDADRDFSLKLPVGQSYRIVLANQLSGGGQHTIGRVVFDGASGTTEWLGANEGGTIDLGRVKPLAKTAGTDVKIECGDCGGSSYEEDEDEDDEAKVNHDDDNECHEKGKSKPDESDDEADENDDDDDRKDCDVCKGEEEADLEPSKTPDKTKCEDRDRDKHRKGEDADRKPCAKGGKGKGKGYGYEDSGSKQDGEDSASSDEAEPSTPAGDAAEGSTCNVTGECTNACTCVASRCTR